MASFLPSLPASSEHSASTASARSHGTRRCDEALWDPFLVSLSAIHGRAVFEQLGVWTPAARVAATGSVVGIVIEGAFVAMLI
jgi:hypothetical protein